MREIRNAAGRNGFTLVELLIAMTIMAILAVIMWLRLENLNQEAYRSSVLADLRSVAVAQELYYQDHMTYGEVDELAAYLPTEGVTVTMNYADGMGFAATATHAALADVTCGYFVGTVPVGAAGPADAAQQPVCD